MKATMQGARNGVSGNYEFVVMHERLTHSFFRPY